tara:strand:- start:2454 stop:3311 length:858 start_codon:yes stop_codon:yes gene_type:complete
MIIWIASYPKSGNTWVRALLSAYLFNNDGKFDFSDLNKIEQFPNKTLLSPFLQKFDDPIQTPKYWIPAQKKINLNKKINFFKTHNAMCEIDGNKFTDKKNTIASIYIVREPRNVITSLANHYGLSVEDAFKFLTNKRKIIFEKNIKKEGFSVEEKGNVHFIGSWEEHYNSWKNIGFSPIKIIKYEDLLKNSEKVFLDILSFLKSFYPIKIEDKKIKKVIKACSFERLKKKEEKEGFEEAPMISHNKKAIFFNLGKENNWKNKLDLSIEKKIRFKFSSEMTELGYM